MYKHVDIYRIAMRFPQAQASETELAAAKQGQQKETWLPPLSRMHVESFVIRVSRRDSRPFGGGGCSGLSGSCRRPQTTSWCGTGEDMLGTHFLKISWNEKAENTAPATPLWSVARKAPFLDS